MKKKILVPLASLLAIVLLICFLNIRVSTSQGIDYKSHSVALPLYLKVLDFFDRHYNYKNLMNKIVYKTDDQRVKALKILTWTCANIRKIPQGFPVIDDHVWNIVIRGYGTAEQACDCFATLCNYAGMNSFWGWVYPQGGGRAEPFCFAKINNRWCLFDPQRGAYFENTKGDFSCVEEIIQGQYSVINLYAQNGAYFDYSLYFNNLPQVEKSGLSRPSIQSPLNRLMFECKKRLKGLKK